MRIHIWHGYLLTGTGSNEYTQALTRTLARAGHEVTVFSQDPVAADLDLGGATVVRPEVPGPLPVFVLDRYAQAEPALLVDLPRPVLTQFVAANAAAIRAQGPADLLICNHVLLGGPVGAAVGMPFVVKAHGSELEYAMRGRADLCAWAGESLATARAVIAGSQHIQAVIAELIPSAAGLVSVIPPGVDTELMCPQPRAQALAQLLAECGHDEPNPHGRRDERLPDHDNATRLGEFLGRSAELSARVPGNLVVYVGKLSAEKGVPRLVNAVRQLGLRAVIVGFGPARADLEDRGEPDILFTGPLQHRHLRHLWPLAAVSVAPSVFPEAFGMVAAEAASCGCPPLVANHSGLAEIAAGIAAHCPAELGDLLSFETDEELAQRLAAITSLPAARWQELSAGSRAAVVARWSWQSVATRTLALAGG